MKNVSTEVDLPPIVVPLLKLRLPELEQEGLETDGAEGKDVFFNGQFIGVVKEPKKFVNRIRERRRDGELPEQMNIRDYSDFQTILISTERG